MGTILYLIFGLIVSTVVLRFIFRLLGANPSTAFVSFIYGLSAPLIAPFAGIFGQPVAVDNMLATGGVFEWASLLAIVVYGLVAGVVSRVAGGVSQRRT